MDVAEPYFVTSALAAALVLFMAAIVTVQARRVRTLERRLLHESRHDYLTGLPNRAYMNEWLDRGIAGAKRAGEKLALVYIDLNGLKQVNEQLGHQAGDEVLIDVARTLRMITRGADFVARLGGDEFAVIMGRVNDRSQIEAGAARFARLTVMKGSQVVDASVGYAVYPDDTDSADGLIKLSDAAMYERKQQRNQR